MSHNPHPSRASRSPRRYSVYSRSPSPSRLPPRQPQDDIPPLTSSHHPFPHPSANFMAGYSPVPPRSIPTQQPTYMDHHPFPRDSYHSFYPTSSNPYLGPTTSQSIHPLPSSQLLHADWPSPGIHPQQDSNSLSMEQQTLRLPSGRPTTFRRPCQTSFSGFPPFSGSSIRALGVSPHRIDAQLPPPTSHQPIPVISVHPLSSTQCVGHSWGPAPPAQFSPPQRSQEQSSAMQGPSRPHLLNRGSFSHAHNFTMKNPVFIDNNLDNFMKDLLRHTIIGAEFDSSARDPPPRCHPGTRLKLIERCINFILECHGEEKLRWVVGPAGVGKSAVMQIVVEKAPDSVIFASIFFSVNGRRDGTKTILTIAYQLAVKCEPYRQFIRDAISLDPSLLQKSLSVQFNKFIVEPFIHRRLFHSLRRFLIAIDGLDECDDPRTQQNLLELITNFSISYPTSPIAWIIASRPEAHIISFFDNAEIQPAYIKEVIRIDSNEACEDVQRYLRDELNKIKLAKPSLRRQREWPSELEFTMIASAAGGLFAYASVAVRFIDNPRYRDPTAQLHHVLEVIKGIPLVDVSGRGHPMAQLDALYARILSNIPDDVMINVRGMLLLCSGDMCNANFRFLCNFLGLSEDTAYGAISYLYAVMRVPEADKANGKPLAYLHKSFEDFLSDSKRSGFSHSIYDDTKQLMARTCLNIIAQIPSDSDGLDIGGSIDCPTFGILRGGPDICNSISLSWPGDERFKETDALLKHDLYYKSMFELCCSFRLGGRFYYESMSCFQALTTRFSSLHFNFPSAQLRHCAFDKLRHELTELGKLKDVPLRTLDYAAICGTISLRFTSPTRTNVDFTDPWNLSCPHEKCELGRFPHHQGWRTEFQISILHDLTSEDNLDALDGGADTNFASLHIKPRHERLFHGSGDRLCDYCSRHFARYFISNPDLLAIVFVDSTGLSFVECSFVDPDGVSEWRYRFFHSRPPKPTDM